jgi:ADP-dependent NAD(P)H-hydrate dehydratase / NAD(P)H-hydrate epimerase
MRAAHRVADVRAAESALMATLPDGALMQRAAAGLAVVGARALGQVYGARVLLLVGGGDNGGDALFAGARLARRGADVRALLLGTPRADGLAALRAAGGRVVGEPCHADLVLDGLVGIGGRGPLRPEAAALAAAARDHVWRTVVAVDVPSGVDADTGVVEGEAVSADLTVCFGTLKPGVLVGEGRERAGRVELVDIGLGPWLPAPAVEVLDDADAVDTRREPPAQDKYTRGVVGVVAGSATYPGAAVLATGGAVRAGAGMVRYTGTAADLVRARWPEAVVTEHTGADVLDAGRVQAWVVGPGLGTDATAAAALEAVLGTDVPVLVDADGLTLLAQHPEWVRRRSAPTVLTPHDREAARFGREVGPDRVGAARALADDLGATVLLKGDATVVAGPRRTFVNATGTPHLATAGTGDVLSGGAGALLATGVDPTLAAARAAHLHGLAGRLSAGDGTTSASRVLDAWPDAVSRARAGTLQG